MPRLKGLVLLLGGKQRLAAGIACRGRILGNLVRQGRKAHNTDLHRRKPRPAQQKVEKLSGKTPEVPNTWSKLSLKFRKKGKRAAQIQDMAGNFASLCQSADGLVDHGIKYAGRHIFQPRS